MHGVIAAGDKQTAAAGAEILKQGGNAVDAAVGAAFAAFMSEIGVVHLGGSGVAQIYDPHTQLSQVYDFFSDMPGRGNPNLINRDTLDFHKVTIDFDATTQDFYIGRGSMAVPGNIFGLCRLAADHGRLPLSQILQPAIALARDGIAISNFQALSCHLLRDLYTHTAGMRDIFYQASRMIRGGDRLYIPNLADTLEALAAEGEDLLRGGSLAQAILEDQTQHGGLLTAEDLTHYQVQLHTPIRVSYRGYDILLPRPCSTGGVLTAFTLKILTFFDLPKWAHGSAEYIQLLCEVMAATTRARRHWNQVIEEFSIDKAVARFLNDDFVSEYAAEVALSLWKGRPSKSVNEPRTPNNTSHLSVIDADGMAVSLTNSAGESAGYVVPGTGFIPNNMLGEEDLHPNGFHTMTAGARISTMMTPTVVLKDGHIKLVVGSGGSIRIRSAILQVITNVLDYEMPLERAVNTPRIHLEKGVLQCEWGYDEAAVAEIEALGYPVNRWNKRSMYFGGVHSVAAEGGVQSQLTAAGDNRRGGATATA